MPNKIQFLFALLLLVNTTLAQDSLESEKNVKPGINDSWKSDKIGPLIGRLETESREVYIHRAEIAAMVGPVPGMHVADVGSGSGFMAHAFARLVGEEGRVYAVDINENLLVHVAKGAKEKNLDNLKTVTCDEKSVRLEPNSVDLVYICDTYHHFEYPRNTMASIYRALRPNGQLVIVDFHRIPGVSREWILGHVRADQETVTKEIRAAGFELTNIHKMDELKENYVLRFRKL